MSRRSATKSSDAPNLDLFLLAVVGMLLLGGLVMLTSASISVAERTYGDPFFFLERQLAAVVVGLVALMVMVRIPSSVWEQLGLLLALFALVLLAAVLIPGLGHTVNGSTRWLHIAGVNLIQVSEPARLLVLLYLSGYAVRRREELRAHFQGFLKPMLLVNWWKIGKSR